MPSREISVAVTEPFDFDLTLQFLEGFSPTKGEIAIDAGSLEKTWLRDGVPITAKVRRAEGGLACALSSPRRIDEDAARAMAERVSFFLGARDDVSAFYAIAARDDAFAPVAARLRGLHHAKFPTPFEAACWALLNQRVGLPRAREMKSALVARFGAAGAFPEAATLARATESAIRACVGVDRKARAVWSAAQAFAKVDEKWLQTAPIGEVDAWVRRIWGAGDFTAAFVLFRGLGRALPPPAGLPWSPAFVLAAKKTYGPKATRASLAKRAAPYGEWLGYWSLYLWASTFVHPR